MFNSTEVQKTADDDWLRRLEKQNIDMRVKTGAATTTSPLIVFLYLLMRDSVPPGIVEERVSDAIISLEQESHVIFTNGWLSAYAADIAARLTTDMNRGEDS